MKPLYLQPFRLFSYSLLLLFLIFTGCIRDNASGGNGTLRWNSVETAHYQLQEMDIEELENSVYDLLIIDYSLTGGEEARLSKKDLARLKDGPAGRKLVLAYMSIGEAENYRFYWQNHWAVKNGHIPSSTAPSWLGKSNPDWIGNYKIKYWDPAWKAIIYGSATSYLDKIIDAGFDGVYLDIIDAYEYWGPEGESGLNRDSAAEDMVIFVRELADYARIEKGQSQFGIFPQNGEGLSVFPDYVKLVTGIGKEDLFYNDDTLQEDAVINYSLEQLARFKAKKKLVLAIDYVTEDDNILDFSLKAASLKYVPIITNRELDGFQYLK